MLNRSASLAMSASIRKALPGKLDIKGHSPSSIYLSNANFILFAIVLEAILYTVSKRVKGLHFLKIFLVYFLEYIYYAMFLSC